MPLRFCRKNTGPGELSFTAAAITSMTGDERGQRGQREQAVEHALGQHAQIGDRRRGQVDRGHAEQIDHRLIEEREAAHVRDEADVHEVVAQVHHEAMDRFLLRDRQREPQLADRALAHERAASR